MSTNISIESALGYHQAGDLQKAEEIYREILAQQPDNVDALHFLGILCYQKKDYGSAVSYIKQVLQINPVLEAAYYNLAIVLQESGQLDEAIDSYQKAIEINPNVAEIYFNLAFALQKKGQLDDAVLNYQKALQINPDFEDAYYNLGVVFQQKGLLDEAVTYYQRALLINPDLADVNNNLGLISQQRGKLDEAISYYILALKINPDLANAYSNLGNAFQEKGELKQAIASYQKALDLNPNLFHVFYNLGNAYKEEGELDKAIAAYEKALDIDPDFYKARWARCMSLLPIIFSDHSHIETARKQYRDDLITLRDSISLSTPQNIEAAAETVGSHQPFYLASQGQNDHDLQKLYGDLVCRIMASKYPQFAERPAMPPISPEKPLRIGIVSGYFYCHSNWKVPIKGWVEKLDKKRFSLYGYYTGRIKDKETETARKCFNRFVEDIYSFEALCKIIRSDNLQILIYPEIGMDPVTVRLAALRLAPVQCTSWGHPDTSGLPTIDYYLSSDLMEPHDADGHYTECLIRLPNLSIYYAPPDVPDVQGNRDTFGLRKNAILYLCCHALFTHLPQYDEIYPRIAEQVGDCHFIFISHESNTVTDQFCSRINQAFKKFNLNADNYVIMLPILDPGKYHALNCLADVYLDTMGWSGCNSTFEAIACNLPVLTLPGAFMKGRHASAILGMMGVKETIVTALDDYIELAVRLGKDIEFRRQISGKIAENKHRIYRDSACIRALEEFLENVVKASN